VGIDNGAVTTEVTALTGTKLMTVQAEEAKTPAVTVTWGVETTAAVVLMAIRILGIGIVSEVAPVKVTTVENTAYVDSDVDPATPTTIPVLVRTPLERGTTVDLDLATAAVDKASEGMSTGETQVVTAPE